MADHLRVLLVEDSENDALLLLRELRHGGFELQAQRVETPQGMLAALESSHWDIILSDYSLPQFSGPHALRLYQDRGLDIPFIVVTGKVGEEAAVAIMKAGAHDYLMKDNLARLVPVVQRELAEARGRRERRQTEAALRESEARYRRMVETASEGIWAINTKLRTTFANRKIAEMLGCTMEQLEGSLATDFMFAEDIPQFKKRIAQRKNGLTDVYEQRYRRVDGSSVWCLVSAAPLVDQEGCFQGAFAMFTDITQRKQAEEALRENEANLNILIENTAGDIWSVDSHYRLIIGNRHFQQHVRSALDHEIARGESALVEFYPSNKPGDWKEYYDRALLGESFIVDIKTPIVTQPRYMEYRFNPIRIMDGPVIGVTVFGRDITSQKQSEERLIYIGTHDTLTDLYNRAYFEMELTRLQNSRQYPVSIVMIDVDGLKEVNDSLGHASGDELLLRCARLIKSAFRAEDIVARIGGDEFSVLLPITDALTAHVALARMRALLADYNRDYPHPGLSLSMGVATSEKGADLLDVLKQADNQMYQDKTQKKKIDPAKNGKRTFKRQ